MLLEMSLMELTYLVLYVLLFKVFSLLEYDYLESKIRVNNWNVRFWNTIHKFIRNILITNEWVVDNGWKISIEFKQ